MFEHISSKNGCSSSSASSASFLTARNGCLFGIISSGDAKLRIESWSVFRPRILP